MQENLETIFRSLRYRNYRLFFGGQLTSLVGTWMQSCALSWLVYRLTNSPLMLGWVIFSSQIFSFVLTPFAGVMVDRLNRQRIILIAQFLMMAQALVLAGLVLSNHVVMWHIVVLSMVLGIISAFEIPARHSFVIDLVEKKEDLGNAIALNSFLFNAARLIGPIIAGIIIALAGEGVCFLINGISYIAVIVSLLAMRINIERQAKNNTHILQDLAEGVRYIFDFKPIKTILLLVSLLSLMGMSYGVLMPVFANDILRVDIGAQKFVVDALSHLKSFFHLSGQVIDPASIAYGLLMASLGFGALVGTLYLASFKHARKLGKVIAMASMLFAAGLIAFSFSHTLIISMILLFVAGSGMMVQMASCNTMLQTLTDDDKRGRVMSFYTMAFIGMTTFGSLLAGWLASKIGAPYTLIIGGSFCVAGAGLFATQIPLFHNAIALPVLDVEVVPGETAPRPMPAGVNKGNY